MAENIIEVQHLDKQYMKNKVIKDVNFKIEKGTICGLIGPNGAGKTTIMKMLGGLVIPTGGTIKLFGNDSEDELSKARTRMSFMIETPYAKEKMSARENLEKQRLMKGIPDKDIVDRVLEIVGLQDTGKKPVKAFSLGMRQRLGIANALLIKPEVMILDEPINGLDPEGIVEIRELLLKLNREEHITIIIASHILSELSLLCTDYLFIHHGEIINDISADELKKQCHEFYLIHTDNDELAAAVLEEKLGLTEFDIDKEKGIRLYESLDEIRNISRTLYENGVIPVVLHMNDANLEQYYMNMVGGEVDAEPDKVNNVSNKKR